MAFKIAKTGFAALSSLDPGWYGQGIYFTTRACYTTPYCKDKNEPCIIIAIAIPGNVYPVIEDPTGQLSLTGKPITPGYNSHYVLTSQDGAIWSTPPQKLFDELVISQEAQLVPLFVAQLHKDQLQKLITEYDRRLPSRENQVDSYTVGW